MLTGMINAILFNSQGFLSFLGLTAAAPAVQLAVLTVSVSLLLVSFAGIVSLGLYFFNRYKTAEKPPRRRVVTEKFFEKDTQAPSIRETVSHGSESELEPQAAVLHTHKRKKHRNKKSVLDNNSVVHLSTRPRREAEVDEDGTTYVSRSYRTAPEALERKSYDESDHDAPPLAARNFTHGTAQEFYGEIKSEGWDAPPSLHSTKPERVNASTESMVPPPVYQDSDYHEHMGRQQQKVLCIDFNCFTAPRDVNHDLGVWLVSSVFMKEEEGTLVQLQGDVLQFETHSRPMGRPDLKRTEQSLQNNVKNYLLNKPQAICPFKLNDQVGQVKALVEMALSQGHRVAILAWNKYAYIIPMILKEKVGFSEAVYNQLIIIAGVCGSEQHRSLKAHVEVVQNAIEKSSGQTVDFKNMMLVEYNTRYSEHEMIPESYYTQFKRLIARDNIIMHLLPDNWFKIYAFLGCYPLASAVSQETDELLSDSELAEKTKGSRHSRSVSV